MGHFIIVTEAMLRVCALIVLLCHVVTGGGQTHQTERKMIYTPSTYLWDKLKLGKSWQVYVQVMIYDLMYSSFYSKGSSNYGTPKTLLDVIGNLPTIATDKHPCRRFKGVIHGRQINGKFYVQGTSHFDYYMNAVFRICGLFNFTYNPSHYNDESAFSDVSDMDQIYPGNRKVRYITTNLQAGDGFIINCTVSEFTASRSHGCADARVKVELYDPGYHWYTMCPNWGIHNFVAVYIKVSIFMEYYQKTLFSKAGDQHFTKLSFHYYILDFRNLLLKLYMLPMIPARQRVKIGVQHMLGVYHDNTDAFVLSESLLLYVGEFPNAVIYAFALYTDDFLTPVVYRANITCNIPDAEAIFYDGPAQTFWQPVLPLLAHWSCSKISNHTTGSSEPEKLHGSAGELNIILFVPTEKTSGNPFITIAWQAERILPGVLQIHKVVLDLSTVTTIHFYPTRSTSIGIIHVQAPENRFVHLGISQINYVSHSEMYPFRSTLCRDGFEMKDPKMIHVFGRICSNSTADNMFNHYRIDGFTVGQEIILKRKQYAWLATMSAVFTASSHICAGYINLMPLESNMYLKDTAPWATVRFVPFIKYFENGSFAWYSNFKVLFERSPKACCKIQTVPFHELVLYEMELDKINLVYTYLTYTIISKNVTSPTRFTIDFSSLDDSLAFTNTSSLYGIRIASLNNRYVKPTLPYTGVWDTEAYSADIGLHSSSLTHAAGFMIQVEDGVTPPVCTYENVTSLTTLLLDLSLLGPCAYVELMADVVSTVLIHKFDEKETCCQFNGYITTDHSMNGNVALELIHADKYQLWFLNTWDLSGNNTIIKFHSICIRSCSIIEIHFTVDRWMVLQTFRVEYHASVIRKRYATGITFPRTSFPFGPDSPFSRFVPWNQVCHNHHCYITPNRHVVATWDEARKACEEQQATLVSINSDFEWALLTQIPHEEEEFIELYHIHEFIIFYIGLFTDVSAKHGAN